MPGSYRWSASTSTTTAAGATPRWSAGPATAFAAPQLTAESLAVAGCPSTRMHDLPLHPGFAATWEKVREIGLARRSAAGSIVIGNGSVSVRTSPGAARPASS